MGGRRQGAFVVVLALASCQALLDFKGLAPARDSSDAGKDAPIADAANDQSEASATCEGEPVWATPDGAVATHADCDGMPGASLLTSSSNCGRCGHSCGNASCDDGRCRPRRETSEQGGVAVDLLGAVGDEVYFYVGETLLRAIGPGGLRDVVNFTAEVTDGGVAGYDWVGGGIAGSPSNLFVHTVRRLFHVEADGSTTLIAAELPPQERELRWFAGTDRSFAYTTRSELVLLASSGAVLARYPSPYSRDLAVSAGEFYWMEQPWSPLADGNSQLPTRTTIQKTIAGGTALVREEEARLTGLVAASDGLYYARLGQGGGIYRLPPDADLRSEPVLVAPDDALTERVAIAVDPTHVYWMRPNGPQHGEIVKRSKCGPATVTIVAHVEDAMLRSAGLAVLGDRLYYTTAHAVVWSVAK